MNKQPLVSIIIPVYNGSNFIKEAIDSALSQTYPNVEVLVINDGSTDEGNTERIVTTYKDKVRYFSKPNGGVSSALNMGIREAKGEWISWLSHDDEYFPDKITVQMEHINKHPETVFIFSQDIPIDVKGRIKYNPRWETFKMPTVNVFALLNANLINGCTTLIKKSCFDVVGLFDENNRTSQDYEMWILIASKFPCTYLPKVVTKGREHRQKGSYILASRARRDIVTMLNVCDERLTIHEIFGDIPTSKIANAHEQLGWFYAQRWGMQTLALKHLSHAANLQKRKVSILEQFKIYCYVTRFDFLSFMYTVYLKMTLSLGLRR